MFGCGHLTCVAGCVRIFVLPRSKGAYGRTRRRGFLGCLGSEEVAGASFSSKCRFFCLKNSLCIGRYCTKKQHEDTGAALDARVGYRRDGDVGDEECGSLCATSHPVGVEDPSVLNEIHQLFSRAKEVQESNLPKEVALERQLNLVEEALSRAVSALGYNHQISQMMLIQHVEVLESHNRYEQIANLLCVWVEKSQFPKNDRINLLRLLVEALHSCGRPGASLPYSRELVGMLRVDEDRASEQRVEALFNHAMTLSYLGDLDGCKDAYMEAYCTMKGWGELRREDEKRAELLKSTLTNLSSCLLKRGCKEEAIPYIEKALGAMEARMEFGLESVKEKREYFMVAEALAELYLELGMKDRSLEVWKRLRRTAYAEEGEVVAKEEKEMLAHLYRRHGQTLILSGKPDFLEEATTALEKSCSIYREMGDKHSLLDALDDLASARALHATDGSSRALSEVFAECLRLSEEVRGRDHAENARHRCNMAIMLCEINEMDEAQRLAAEACSTLERLKMDREEAYLSSKRVLEAIKCLKELSKNRNRLIKKNPGKRP